MILRPRPKDADPQERALWGELTSIGMVFPIAIVLGFFLGRFLGRAFGHPGPGQWIGMAFGIATGFWELYKVTLHLDALDKQPPPEGQENQKRDEDDRGSDA